jgi:hypothetical protein
MGGHCCQMATDDAGRRLRLADARREAARRLGLGLGCICPAPPGRASHVSVTASCMDSCAHVLSAHSHTPALRLAKREQQGWVCIERGPGEPEEARHQRPDGGRERAAASRAHRPQGALRPRSRRTPVGLGTAHARTRPWCARPLPTRASACAVTAPDADGIDPESTRNRPEIDPKSTRNRLGSDAHDPDASSRDGPGERACSTRVGRGDVLIGPLRRPWC